MGIGLQLHYHARHRQLAGLDFIKNSPEKGKIGIIPDSAAAIKVGLRHTQTESTQRGLGEITMFGTTLTFVNEKGEGDLQYFLVLSDIKDKSSWVQTKYTEAVLKHPKATEIIKANDELHFLSDNAAELTSREWKTFTLSDVPDMFDHIKVVADHKQPPKHSKDLTDRLFSFMKLLIAQMYLSKEGVDNDLEKTARRMIEANKIRNLARVTECKPEINCEIITMKSEDLWKPAEVEIFDFADCGSSLCHKMVRDENGNKVFYDHAYSDNDDGLVITPNTVKLGHKEGHPSTRYKAKAIDPNYGVASTKAEQSRYNKREKIMEKAKRSKAVVPKKKKRKRNN